MLPNSSGAFGLFSNLLRGKALAPRTSTTEGNNPISERSRGAPTVQIGNARMRVAEWRFQPGGAREAEIVTGQPWGWRRARRSQRKPFEVVSSTSRKD